MKQILTLLFGFLLLPLTGNTTIEVCVANTQAGFHAEHHSPKQKRVRKPGLLEKVRVVRKAKKAVKTVTKDDGRPPSKTALFALYFFIGFFILAWIPVAFFGFLALAAWVTSVVLSFMVLSRDESRKSRVIATVILVVSAFIVLLFAITLALLISAFGW